MPSFETHEIFSCHKRNNCLGYSVPVQSFNMLTATESDWDWLSSFESC